MTSSVCSKSCSISNKCFCRCDAFYIIFIWYIVATAIFRFVFLWTKEEFSNRTARWSFFSHRYTVAVPKRVEFGVWCIVLLFTVLLTVNCIIFFKSTWIPTSLAIPILTGCAIFAVVMPIFIVYPLCACKFEIDPEAQLLLSHTVPEGESIPITNVKAHVSERTVPLCPFPYVTKGSIQYDMTD